MVCKVLSHWGGWCYPTILDWTPRQLSTAYLELFRFELTEDLVKYGKTHSRVEARSKLHGISGEVGEELTMSQKLKIRELSYISNEELVKKYG